MSGHFVEHAAAGDFHARVVLADRVDLVRAGLRAALEFDPDVEVVGEARDGREAVAKARQFQADLVVLDADMPEIDGLSALQLLKQTCPKVRVLLLGTCTAPDYVCQVLDAGAAGYVLKAASLSEVRSAVREALRGDLPIDARVVRQVLRRVLDTPALEASPPGHERLSAREIQVLERVARGRTNRQIGEDLVITPHTVKAHIEHILAKLSVRDRTQAAVRAIELGYVRKAPVGLSRF